MSPRSRLPEAFVFADSQFKTFRSLALVLTIFALAAGSAHAASVERPRLAASADCQVVEPDPDTSVKLEALQGYEAFIRHLLLQERYDTLECIANAARTNKTKFRGGFWKLHVIYAGLGNPVDDGAHITEADWSDHIDRLQHWISAKPDSVTARISLAQVYIDFAWAARGNGYVDSVTENGWRLIGERTQQAEEQLEEASKLPTKCPEWYLTAQELAQLQGTDKEKLTELLAQAVAMEPTYQYFYRVHFDLLAEKWYGDAGDQERFAEEAADRLGGSQGDILYFQITSRVICSCNDQINLKLWSWPRMQKGFKELTEKSGSSLINLNVLSYMAIKMGDPTVADQTFASIGDNWESDIWGTKSVFDKNKKWAADVASAMAWEKSLRDKADADMRTPEGIEIKKKFDEKFAARIQNCAASSSGDELAPFTFIVAITEKGVVGQIVAIPSTKVSDCVVKQGPFLTLQPPPHSPFWLMIEVDPSNLTTASVH